MSCKCQFTYFGGHHGPKMPKILEGGSPLQIYTLPPVSCLCKQGTLEVYDQNRRKLPKVNLFLGIHFGLSSTQLGHIMQKHSTLLLLTHAQQQLPEISKPCTSRRTTVHRQIEPPLWCTPAWHPKPSTCHWWPGWQFPQYNPLKLAKENAVQRLTMHPDSYVWPLSQCQVCQVGVAMTDMLAQFRQQGPSCPVIHHDYFDQSGHTSAYTHKQTWCFRKSANVFAGCDWKCSEFLILPPGL